MVNLSVEFEKYVSKNLGLSVSVTRWQGDRGLPHFLRDQYEFYGCTIMQQPVILMAAQNEGETTPAAIRKHVDKVMAIGECEVIYLSQSIASYNRKRLIEHRVSFAVPGNQMYLPTLGVDLREHIRKIRGAKPQGFSPSTQAVILYGIYHGLGDGITPAALSERLNYTPMTLTRALDELESVALGEVRVEGRTRILRFPTCRRELWDKARPRMRSPVKKQVTVQQVPEDSALAGLSALSRYTMLAEPRTPVYAISSDQWKVLRQLDGVKEVPVAGDDTVAVEIWTYAPQLFATRGCVDPLSLFLSVGDPDDERIEMALEHLLETMTW